MSRWWLAGTAVLLTAGAFLVVVDGPFPEPASITLDVGSPVTPDALLDLDSLRTMNETAFLRVEGVLHNRDVSPVGPVVVRGRFTGMDGEQLDVGISFTEPDVVAPGAAACFALVVPAHPSCTGVELEFGTPAGKPPAVRLLPACTGEEEAP